MPAFSKFLNSPAACVMTGTQMASTLLQRARAFWFTFEGRGQLPHLQLGNAHSIFALDGDKGGEKNRCRIGFYTWWQGK